MRILNNMIALSVSVNVKCKFTLNLDDHPTALKCVVTICNHGSYICTYIYIHIIAL